MSIGIVTYTGKFFDFSNPEPGQICITDIAHALALTNRYGGHTRTFYSVAEHCVRCSYLTVGNPLVNLLHDVAEAYIGDIPSPQKGSLYFRMFDAHLPEYLSFRNVEDGLVLPCIFTALGVDEIMTPENLQATRKADLIMLATEVRDLMPPQWMDKGHETIKDVLPDVRIIHPWPWELAEDEYLGRFEELLEGQVK